MAYKLDRPVRVTADEDRKLVVIDAYPSFTRRLAEAFEDRRNIPGRCAPGAAQQPDDGEIGGPG